MFAPPQLQVVPAPLSVVTAVYQQQLPSLLWKRRKVCVNVFPLHTLLLSSLLTLPDDTFSSQSVTAAAAMTSVRLKWSVYRWCPVTALPEFRCPNQHRAPPESGLTATAALTLLPGVCLSRWSW